MFREHNPAEFEVFVRTEFPHQRLASATEVAEVVTFLLASRASWITGANIAVDGGQRHPTARRFAATRRSS
jgi:NAD(P)-dependent dehydrogenase (short-subunit alcohol dehydrogenase family)